MHQTLKRFIAVWFVSQIVLPFTAPLQTCELKDLFGAHGHETPGPRPSTESSTTPTPIDPEANSFVSPFDAPAESATTSLIVRTDAAMRVLQVCAFLDVSSTAVQQTVLRL